MTIIKKTIIKKVPEKKPLVYIIQEGDGDIYKVGKTDVLSKRLESLQCGNPRVLKVVKTFETPNPIGLESDLKKLLKPYRIRGEWYKLDETAWETIENFIYSVETKWSYGFELSDDERDLLAEMDDESWDYPGSPYGWSHDPDYDPDQFS